jgi:hypothetical protein
MFKLVMGVALSVAAYGAVARPGTINYTEGQVTVDGSSIGAKQLGSTELAPGRVLQTGTNGRAEMLLTPGVFLRLSDNSAVRMISPSLTDTQVAMVRGRATLEVDLLAKENHLVVRAGASSVVIDKKGIYEFNADQPALAVYDGKATALVGDRSVEVGKGKELALDNTAVKPQKFDRKEEDSLMAWSKLRSQYVAEANAASAQTIVVDNPGWWGGTGWYWNPYFSTWAFVPGSGYLYNPWGFGFYSPAYFYYNPPLYYSPGFYGNYRAYRPTRGVLPGRAGVTGNGLGRTAAPGMSRPAPSMSRPAPMMSRPAPMGGGGGAIHFGGRRR